MKNKKRCVLCMSMFGISSADAGKFVRLLERHCNRLFSVEYHCGKLHVMYESTWFEYVGMKNKIPEVLFDIMARTIVTAAIEESDKRTERTGG